MNTRLYRTYSEIKNIIGEDEIFNHYINNFIQHIYISDSSKVKNELSEYVYSLKNDLLNNNRKAMLYRYLKLNHSKNIVSDSRSIIKNFYNKSYQI